MSFSKDLVLGLMLELFPLPGLPELESTYLRIKTSRAAIPMASGISLGSETASGQRSVLLRTQEWDQDLFCRLKVYPKSPNLYALEGTSFRIKDNTESFTRI